MVAAVSQGDERRGRLWGLVLTALLQAQQRLLLL
jgi:hypothetical protein